MIQLHTFRNLIAGHEKLRRSLLLVLSLLALATAATGNYLALSHWLTHRRLRRQ